MHARSVPSLAEAAGAHGFRADPLLLRPAEHGVFAVFPQDRFISAGLGGAGRWHATMVPTRATRQSRVQWEAEQNYLSDKCVYHTLQWQIEHGDISFVARWTSSAGTSRLAPRS